jgi:hypothetical protein
MGDGNYKHNQNIISLNNANNLNKPNKYKLHVIKTIFIRNDKFIDINVKSLRSLLSYISLITNKFSSIHLSLYSWINKSDNNLYESMHQLLINLINEYNHINISFNTLDENIGKLNVMKKYTDDYLAHVINDDIVLYLDHDIIIINDIIKVFSDINHEYDNKIIKMISFDQEPDYRHNQRIYNNTIIINKNKYYYDGFNSHVATGCFLCNVDFFNKLNIYMSKQEICESNDVYGEEDFIISECLDSYNYINIVSHKKIYHGYDNDQEYAEWKKKQLINIFNRKNNFFKISNHK